MNSQIAVLASNYIDGRGVAVYIELHPMYQSWMLCPAGCAFAAVDDHTGVMSILACMLQHTTAALNLLHDVPYQYDMMSHPWRMLTVK